MPTYTIDPWVFLEVFHERYESFMERCENSLRDCGDYTQAGTCTLPGVPQLLFEEDAIFRDILEYTEEETEAGLFPPFEPYIAEQDGIYEEAFQLYNELPPNKRSKAAPVHDLFPFHLSITGPSGPWPLVRIKGLLDAYHWARSPILVEKTRECGSIPAVFLTGDCVALYSVALRAKIGDWLVNHQAYWLGIDYSATGVVFDSTFGDHDRHRCTVNPHAFHQNYDTDYECFEDQCIDSLRACGDYSKAEFPYRCVPQLLFEGEELFGDILAISESGPDCFAANRVLTENHNVPFGFSNYVAKQNSIYMKALELHAALPPNLQSKAVPVHDLFPFHLAITGPSGPWPLVRIKGLLDAYNWAHSPNLVQETRDRGDIPSLFLTEECVALYAIVVRANIGEWLVHHHAYWLGIKFTATGVVPAVS